MKYCLVQDDSSHWYCIPIESKKDFERWAYNDEDEDLPFDFDEYRLNMNISCYCFENFKENE